MKFTQFTIEGILSKYVKKIDFFLFKKLEKRYFVLDFQTGVLKIMKNTDVEHPLELKEILFRDIMQIVVPNKDDP